MKTTKISAATGFLLLTQVYNPLQGGSLPVSAAFAARRNAQALAGLAEQYEATALGKLVEEGLAEREGQSYRIAPEGLARLAEIDQELDLLAEEVQLHELQVSQLDQVRLPGRAVALLDELGLLV